MTMVTMQPPIHKPSSVLNRQNAWRLRIATLVFLSSAALALHCHNNNNNNNNNHNNNNNNIDSSNTETTQIRPIEFESSNLNLPPKFNSNDVRGLIRTIRVALPPDRDSFQISPSDGSSQVTIHCLNIRAFCNETFKINCSLCLFSSNHFQLNFLT